ncbi:hypothetical protein CC86DRAFT_383622 [Ophiobolus disseminans]|uniref:BTB domain-containing protein n=1 Tax=Ophiobolus disseminans TaxID=1469910 RepID=A0A6A6ZWB0_9PLEO|nr:hypothetical protein CC86DRAFT_383622 [Ophiobolus disseminans]
MNSINSSRGYNVTLPSRLQVDNIVQMMKILPDGHDIRRWPEKNRKELAVSEVVNLVNENDGIIASAPKLALVVASPDFREFFMKTPDANLVKVHPSVDEASVRALTAWLTSIVNSAGKFGVSLPDPNDELIKIRHAAHALGMELFVRHFCKSYKDDLRNRRPSLEECELLERCAVGPVDDMITGMGERLAYLRRRGDFSATFITTLAVFLQAHPVTARAVYDADERAARTRHA